MASVTASERFQPRCSARASHSATSPWGIEAATTIVLPADGFGIYTYNVPYYMG